MSEQSLVAATRLIAAGAGQSARRLLGNRRGADANRLRMDAARARLRSGVYALGVTLEGEAIVVPVEAIPGEPRRSEEHFDAACHLAFQLAERTLGEQHLPRYRLELSEWLSAFGCSMGLPAWLAFLYALIGPERRPRLPVLATGRLTEDGRIVAVNAADRKYAAALAELGQSEGILLMPAEEASRAGVVAVSHIDEVMRLLFGIAPLRCDPSLVALDALLERSRDEHDHAKALALLDSVSVEDLSPADRVRLDLERCTRLRHAGMTDAAASLQAAAVTALAQYGSIVGAEAVERYELEHWLTRLDAFELDRSIAALRDRLRRPFLLLGNVLRCRGALAQALAMAGQYAEAVELRKKNLVLHECEDRLKRVLPGTYCYLCLDSALDGKAADFEGYAEALVRATNPGDTHQWRYNAAILVRGLVRLGQFELALAWSEGKVRLFDARTPESLWNLFVGGGIIATHPEVSTTRALCRALRKTGHPQRAIALAECVRVQQSQGVDLVAWLCNLAKLERAFAYRDLGDDGRAEALINEARIGLLGAHPGATEAHRELVDGSVEDLETAMDRVWY